MELSRKNFLPDIIDVFWFSNGKIIIMISFQY
jgi:hypothetical protein